MAAHDHPHESIQASHKPIRSIKIADIYGIVRDFSETDAKDSSKQMAAAPANFHQATLFFSLMQKGTSFATIRNMLLMSHTLVWMQLFSVLAFVYGVYNATCSRSTDCFAGQFCAPSSGLKQTLCHPCDPSWSPLCNEDGSLIKSPPFTPTLWSKSLWPEEPMSAKLMQKMCLACVIDLSYLPGRSATIDNVSKMSTADVLIFALCLALITLSIVNELRDISLCAMSRLADPALLALAAQRKEKGLRSLPLAVLALTPNDTISFKIHWLLLIHQCVRQYAMLPVLTMAIPMLIVVQGSGGVSICLNSVGVLFVLEMDNLAYQYGVQERDRESMESEGKLYVLDHIQESLTRTRNFHFVSVPLGIIITVLLMYWDITGPYHVQIVWMIVCSLSYWGPGLLEAIVVTKGQAFSMQLKLFVFELLKIIWGEFCIWCALCALYPYFIPQFFSGNFW